MGGGTQEQTNTTRQQLTPEQQALVSAAMPGFQQFAASGLPTLPTGDQAVAPFTGAQTAGQQSVLNSVGSGKFGGSPTPGSPTGPGGMWSGGPAPGGGGGAAPNMTNVLGTAAGTNNLLSSGAFLDPASNPVVQNAVKAATDPIFQNLAQSTIPQQQAAAAAGSGVNFGGSREGIAEGLDTQGAQRAAGQAGAGIMNTALGQGLQATGQAIAQAPTTAASLTLPGAVQEAVGTEQQTQQQNVLNANNAAALQQWLLPLIKGQSLAGGAAGLPGGSTTSTGQTSSDPGLFADILGGASAAGGLMGGLGKLGSAAAGAGGLGPLLAFL
jgi:hypothetical protein